jgi:hypothetical protein
MTHMVLGSGRPNNPDSGVFWVAEIPDFQISSVDGSQTAVPAVLIGTMRVLAAHEIICRVNFITAHTRVPTLIPMAISQKWLNALRPINTTKEMISQL